MTPRARDDALCAEQVADMLDVDARLLDAVGHLALAAGLPAPVAGAWPRAAVEALAANSDARTRVVAKLHELMTLVPLRIRGGEVCFGPTGGKELTA